MTSAEERRTRACQRRLHAVGADAVVLFPSPNLRYLTGITEEPSERHFLFLLSPDGDPTLLVPNFEAQAVREATWIDDVRTWSDEGDPTVALRAVLDDRGLGEMVDGRVLVDDRMWARFTQDLAAVLDAEWGLASEALGPLRMRKDDAEVDALRRAGVAADEVLTRLRAMGADAVGRTETELATKIERLLADAGGTGVSFEPIVAAGPNGARPHHAHGDRRIRAGEPVVLDFGTRVDGYPSDITRTVVFDGEPTDEFRRVHAVVREAQSAAVRAVEPGVEARTIDRAARDVIEEAGYGEAFVHRTGHGVGLEVHEAPYIAASSRTTLEPGMVFSIEPGVYLEGEFGVRIEDLVVVTDGGCERLNTAPRGWNLARSSTESSGQ